MKQLIKNYTINSGTKTITLTDFSTVLLERLYLITDITNSTNLYQFNTTSGVSVATNVLTFTSLTASNTDKLQIIYDTATGDPTYDTPPIPAGASTAVNQATEITSLSAITTNTANSATSANQTNKTQFTKITDGTNDATVKAASTAPTATDKAIVVVESPNSALVTNTAPLTSSTSGAYTRQDSTATIAKETGGNLSTIATNTGNSSSSANQTNGTQKTQLTDGTNAVNVLKSDGTAVGQNSQLTAGAFLSVPYTTTTVQAVGTTDVGNYSWVTIHQTAFGTANTTTPQVSNDNVNWFSLTTMANNSSTGAPSTAYGAVTGSFSGSLNGRFFRLNITSISAGTTAGTLVFSSQPRTQSAMAVGASQQGTWAVGSSSSTGTAAPSNAFYMGLKTNSGNLLGLTSGDSPDSSNANVNLGVQQFAYNGTSVTSGADKVRNNNNGTTGDAGAKTASFTGATQTNYNQQSAYITVLCGTVSGTSPTLTAQLQWSPDSGTTWLSLGPASTAVTTTGTTITILAGPLNWSQTPGATPVALTTGSTVTTAINAPLPRSWRLNFVIGGTTPSFAITNVFVNYVGL